MAEQALEFKNLGNVAFREKRFEEAVENYSQAISHAPNDHILYSNRSGSYASLEDFENALKDASKAIEIKPDYVRGYVRKGLAEVSLSKFDDALETYDMGLAQDPSNAQLLEGKQNAETQKLTGGKAVPGMDNSAVAGVIAKLKANPKTAEYLKDTAFVAQVQQFLGNPDLMKSNPQMFMTLIQQDKRFMDCFMVLQGLDPSQMPSEPEGGAPGASESEPFQTEEEEESKQQQQAPPAPTPTPKQTAKATSDEATIIKNEGNAFYMKKKFDLALEKYNQAIALKPTEILFYNNKAAVYVEKKDYEQATECCEEALRISKEHQVFDFAKTAKIYARLGSINEKQKNIDAAIEWYDKSLLEDYNANIKLDLRRVQKIKTVKSDADYINPELAEEANEKAKVFFKEGSFKEALEQYTDATKRNPEGAKYYCNRGLVFIKLMEWAKAVEDFEKAISIDNNYIKAYIKKGDCLSFMKDLRKSKQAYETALKLEPTNAEAQQKMQQLQQKMFSSGGTEEEQKMRAQQAQKDPEIQEILRTPEIQNALKAMQTNQGEAMKILQDPKLGPKIQTLIEAGVLKMG